MPIRIYNSLTRTKDDFIPLNPPCVNIYTCGVTVYDECHIGHARSLYVFEVIRRYLAYRGFQVTFVRNITDIDDKIINRANELKIGWQDLVKGYIERYYDDLGSLGISRGDCEPRAAENIPQMIQYIEGLVVQGYAYVTESGVYFNVRRFNDYGKLSGQSIDQMLSGARKEPDETKQDPLDFALWKRAKPGEPSWPSPWGQGRPGWHIECSVMSQRFLKTDTLDIHAGGRDLIFPHHENEIAQAEALTGKPFSRYWIHHGLLTIDGQKMAKSLGNFVSIKDFLVKYKDADLLKIFLLSAHYSHPLDYNEKKIQESKEALERILILRDRVESKFKIQNSTLRLRSGVMVSETEPSKFKTKFNELDGIKNRFIEAMDDDFNTPQGLAAIFELINLANKNIEDLSFISSAKSLLFELKDILGLNLTRGIGYKDIEDDIKILIDRRDAARKKGDFREADKVRKELEEKGIILEDTKEGTIWRRRL